MDRAERCQELSAISHIADQDIKAWMARLQTIHEFAQLVSSRFFQGKYSGWNATNSFSLLQPLRDLGLPEIILKLFDFFQCVFQFSCLFFDLRSDFFSLNV